jgi:hypothetical protein
MASGASLRKPLDGSSASLARGSPGGVSKPRGGGPAAARGGARVGPSYRCGGVPNDSFAIWSGQCGRSRALRPSPKSTGAGDPRRLPVVEPLRDAPRVRLASPSPWHGFRRANASAKLQRIQIRVCGAAANNSIAPLSASAFVRPTARGGRGSAPPHPASLFSSCGVHHGQSSSCPHSSCAPTQYKCAPQTPAECGSHFAAHSPQTS